LRNFRFRLVVLPVKRWLAFALWYLIFPLPVTFNLLAAPRLLFNFNILYYPLYEITLNFSCPLSVKQYRNRKTIPSVEAGYKFGLCTEKNLTLWRQNHHHVSPLESGSLLDHRQILDSFNEAIEYLLPELWVGDFPAAEEDGNLDLVSFVEKTLHMAKLELEIMLLRAGSYLNFLHMDDGLMFSGLLDPFVLLVLVLSIIHDPADWRLRIGGYLHEVQSFFFGNFHGLFQR